MADPIRRAELTSWERDMIDQIEAWEGVATEDDWFLRSTIDLKTNELLSDVELRRRQARTRQVEWKSFWQQETRKRP